MALVRTLSAELRDEVGDLADFSQPYSADSRDPRHRAVTSLEEIPDDLWNVGESEDDEEGNFDEGAEWAGDLRGGGDALPRIVRAVTTTAQECRRDPKDPSSRKKVSGPAGRKSQRLPPRSSGTSSSGGSGSARLRESPASANEGLLSSFTKIKTLGKSSSALETVKRRLSSIGRGKGAGDAGSSKLGSTPSEDVLPSGLQAAGLGPHHRRGRRENDGWNSAPIAHSLPFVEDNDTEGFSGGAPLSLKKLTGPTKAKPKSASKASGPAKSQSTSGREAADVLGPMVKAKATISKSATVDDSWNSCPVAFSMPIRQEPAAGSSSRRSQEDPFADPEGSEFPGFSVEGVPDSNGVQKSRSAKQVEGLRQVKADMQALRAAASCDVATEEDSLKPFVRRRDSVKSMPENLEEVGEGASPGEMGKSPLKSPLPVAQVKYISSFAEHRRRVMEAERRERAEIGTGESDCKGVSQRPGGDGREVEEGGGEVPESDMRYRLVRSRTSTRSREVVPLGLDDDGLEAPTEGTDWSARARGKLAKGRRSTDVLFPDDLPSGITLEMS